VPSNTFHCGNPSFKLSLDHSGKRAPRRKGLFVDVKDKPDFYIFYDGGGNAQLEAGVRAKPYTRRRARRDVNHNFQPQRSHLNRSSGFSLEAVLPQRGHFIVHICVKGPSGVTLKIWNVDSTVASSNRHLIGIHRDAIRFLCISGSTTLTEKLAQQNQSVEGSRVLRRMQKQRGDIR
jgi:hypothetical protein